MEPIQTVTTEPPSSSQSGAASLPSRAFGRGTSRYWAFLEALADGLRAYEALRARGGEHAGQPVPAA